MTKKMGKKEMFFIGIILLLAVGFYIFQSTRQVFAESATITLNGEVIKTVSLAEDMIFSIEQEPNVFFEVRDGAIAFIHSDCPDLICVHRGFISSSSPQAAACLPKGLLLYISETSPLVTPAVDAVAG